MIRKYLDLNSTQVAANEIRTLVRDAKKIPLFPVVVEHEYGFFINTGEVGANYPDPFMENKYPTLLTVLRYAHENGCTWINLDSDAEIEENLPTY